MQNNFEIVTEIDIGSAAHDAHDIYLNLSLNVIPTMTVRDFGCIQSYNSLSLGYPEYPQKYIKLVHKIVL